MQEMLAGDLVPGDTVNISLGDRVPADIRLTEVRNFRGLHTHNCLFCLNSFLTTHRDGCGNALSMLRCSACCRIVWKACLFCIISCQHVAVGR